MPQPAGYADLKAALPGADSVFLCSQMEANATVGQAQTAWMAEQNRRLTTANKEADDAKAAAKANTMGVAPLGTGTAKQPATEGGDAIARFNEAVEAKQAKGMNRSKAVVAVVHENHAGVFRAGGDACESFQAAVVRCDERNGARRHHLFQNAARESGAFLGVRAGADFVYEYEAAGPRARHRPIDFLQMR